MVSNTLTHNVEQQVVPFFWHFLPHKIYKLLGLKDPLCHCAIWRCKLWQICTNYPKF